VPKTVKKKGKRGEACAGCGEEGRETLPRGKKMEKKVLAKGSVPRAGGRGRLKMADAAGRALRGEAGGLGPALPPR